MPAWLLALLVAAAPHAAASSAVPMPGARTGEGTGREAAPHIVEPRAAARSPAPVNDVLIVTAHVNCITEMVMHGLRRHLAGAGQIHAVTPPHAVADCLQLAGASVPGLSCHDERRVLDYASLRLESITRPGGRNARGWGLAKERTKWYYQQLLKLLASERIDLAERWVVWDGDNILVRDYDPEVDGKVRFPIGGFKNFGALYERTTNPLLGTTAGRQDIVVHQMAFRRDALSEMLRHLCGGLGPERTPEACARHIMDSIPADASPQFGLSEYHLNFAWMASRYPHLVSIDTSTKFRRVYKYKAPIKRERGNASSPAREMFRPVPCEHTRARLQETASKKISMFIVEMPAAPT